MIRQIMLIEVELLIKRIQLLVKISSTFGILNDKYPFIN